MTHTGVTVDRPTAFAWLLVVLAMGSIFSGFYEVLPIVDKNTLSGDWWQILIHVIMLTKAFKFFCCLTFSITFCSLVWGLIQLATFYFTHSLMLMQHVVVLVFVIGLFLMVVSLVKNRKDFSKLGTDPVFLIGSGMVTNSCSLVLGISWGQSKSKL